ncbi:MAG: nitroreductase [Eubacteriales bacterium]|nr:nitroreductase [Eubacteriales bacterium]
MDTMDAIRQRHSVRRYTAEPIRAEHLDAMEKLIASVEEKSGLEIRLITDEPKAFDCFLSHYGSFRNVSNYMVISVPKEGDWDEKVGYWGEMVVLEAQKLGLRTCWVALTYKKTEEVRRIREGYRLSIVISIGYGENDGKIRKSKSASEVSNLKEDSPEWFRNGVEAALMAPTAVNQQRFYFEYDGSGGVRASCGRGNLTKMDLGIAKYHFEAGAGKENFHWI